MSEVIEDEFIDQTEYDEFAGVDERNFPDEDEDSLPTSPPQTQPEITPNWQLDSEHTFVKEHFFKLTSCEYCGDVIASLHWHQGMRCKECHFDVHFNCMAMAPKNCLSLHNTNPLRSDILQPHSFYEKHFSCATFCNICRKMLYGVGKQGFACSTCQFVTHEECLVKAPINCPPQKLDAPLSSDLQHYWVEGNLSGPCALCKKKLSKLTILYGFRCTYCMIRVCPACFPNIQHESCDEGPLVNLKLGPGHVITNASDKCKKWSIDILEGRKPLMVFINKRSGGQVGQLIARRLGRFLNPSQIIDLSQGGPLPMLKAMRKCKSPYRVLACGGDGTAAWLLSALDKMAEKGETYLPPVAVLPLGTGNDLARVLGWGGGYDNESMGPILNAIEHGHEVLLDRWKLEIENVGLVDGKKNPMIMNNYFSIGVDAKIALDFHRKREANPSQFKSCGINKVIYAGLGAAAIFEGGACLSKVLQIELDGQVLALPKGLEGVMVLNLPSWAGGKNPWGKPSSSEGRRPQTPCDGIFELIGVTGSGHLGQIQARFTDGQRLGQGSEVIFTWLTPDILPVQLDGEPWEEPQSIIKLSFFKQSRMIASPKEREVWPAEGWVQTQAWPTPLSNADRPEKASSSSKADTMEVESPRRKKSKKPRKAGEVVELIDSSDIPSAAVSLEEVSIDATKPKKKSKKNGATVDMVDESELPPRKAKQLLVEEEEDIKLPSIATETLPESNGQFNKTHSRALSQGKNSEIDSLLRNDSE